MTSIIHAQLVLGFRAGPLYRGWSKGRRAILSQAVLTDIQAKTTPTRRIQWLAIPLALGADNMIDEAGVRDAIAQELAKTALVGATDPYLLALKTDEFGDPVPTTEVTYVIVEGRVVCQHNYLVTLEPRDESSARRDWDVADADEPAHVVAQLAFGGSLP